MKIEEINYLNELFDRYQLLLTDKQREYFKEYYEEDLSLSEIASNHEVSRNAVHKQLKTIERMLYSYEEKLKLVETFNLIYEIMDQVSDDDVKEKLMRIVGE